MDKAVEEKFTESEYARVGFAPRDRGIYFQHHRPTSLNAPYHFHPSIEVNFLQDCDMAYSFSGQEVEIERSRFCVFWAAHPHRAIRVTGTGMITNAYVTLSEFLLWQMPAEFVNILLSGAVLSAKSELDGDKALAERWANELENTGAEWQHVHATELHARLSRLAIDGWDVLHQPKESVTKKTIGGNAIIQFERMLRFVAQHFADHITIGDVAKEGGISENYAISLFRNMLGQTIKGHITDMRIFHAKMLLAESDQKILPIAMDCGYGSLSAFYRAFQAKTGISPAAFRDQTGRVVPNENAQDEK